MAAVTFRRNTSTRYADAWCERTWALPATGSIGTARVRLPYSAAAASSTYINPEGGSWLEIADEGGCGRWVGIIRSVSFGATEIELEAAQPWVILGDRVLRWEGAYQHAAPAGYYAARVLREALSGVPWFWTRYLGAAEAMGPIIRNFQITGQDVWSALLELMEQSDSELMIDAETGEVNWGGALSGDLRQMANLIADGNFREWSYSADSSERISEVIVKRGTERNSAYSGATALVYPGQVMVTADDGYKLATVASTELLYRQQAQITITGSVGTELYGLRERDFLRVVIPAAGFTGKEHPCRLLWRRLADDSALMELGLQVINESIGVRVPPPMRGGSRSTSGAKGRGSFAQRMRSTQRLAWRTHLRES